jgi:thiol-disulfide isomerase/thioredoxin
MLRRTWLGQSIVWAAGLGWSGAQAQGATPAAGSAPPVTDKGGPLPATDKGGPLPVTDKGGPLPALGTRLALPEVTLFDGSRFGPAQADGQVLVVYWWASWCPFCAVQSPLIEQLWRVHRSRGLQVLALSVDRQAGDATAYLAKRGYTFPAGLQTPEVARVLPKPKGLPVTLVRGRDGRLLMAEAGQLFPEDIEQIARWL